MFGIVSFAIGIIAVIISFFTELSLVSFILAILAIIVAVISAYVKDKAEIDNKEKEKDSRALEVGSIIISGAAIFSYFVFLIISLMK